MMKFFRKYNKHLLAVFMSLLLVIWMGGDALTSMVRRDPSKTVIGTAISGPITQGDTMRVKNDARLLAPLGILSWQQAFHNPNAAQNDQIADLEWVLLEREAERLGMRVSIAQAKSNIARTPQDKTRIEVLAGSRFDVPVNAIYEAAARTLSVFQMRDMFAAGLNVPESQLRRLALNVMERAAVEVVAFPAESFADPDETFTELRLQAQFEAFKGKPTGGTGLNFSYYVDPQVKLDYFKVDPKAIKAQLPDDDTVFERRAYSYWKLNKTTDWRFQRSPEEQKALREQRAADAGTNGESPAPPSPFYETFEEARTKAIDAIKQQDAESEAARIAKALARALAEPWISIPQLPTEFQPAPEAVKSHGYYEQVAAQLPETLKFPGIPEVGHLGWVTARDLANMESLGSAGLPLQNNRSISVAQLAFNVEGFVTIPEESPQDRDLFLSKYQSLTKPLPAADGAIYIFRVTATQEGHAPTSLDEVADRVASDLRLINGMARAKAAAETFAANVGTAGLKNALEADIELFAKITPDRGGYLSLSSIVRNSKQLTGRKNFVPALGEVTEAFITKAFELAAEPEANKVAVIELPALAQATVMKGKELKHFYAEDYAKLHQMLKIQIARKQKAAALNAWLAPKSIRERSGYERNRGE